MKKYVSTALRKGKTDKLDSISIANYGVDNWFKLVDYTLPDELYGQLRLLGRQYAHYITIRVENKLALTDLLDRTMPGIKTLLSGKRSEEPIKDKLSDFVAEYWHFDNISKKSEAQFIRSYCAWAKGKDTTQVNLRLRRKQFTPWLAMVSLLCLPVPHRPKC